MNGKWYSPVDNAPPNRGGRRKPTARSRNFAQQRRQQSQQPIMAVGAIPINLPSWKSFPNEQWHEVSGFSFPTEWTTGDVAYASMKSELGKIKSLHDTTKVYSVMYGFICQADGYAGFKDDFDSNDATGPTAPDRVRFKAGKYCARQMVFQPGTTVSDVKSTYNFVWKFDAAPAAKTSNIIQVVKFYVSTSPLANVKPPPNFLVCEE